MAIESGVMMTLTLAVTASALCHVEAWLRDGNGVWGDDDIRLPVQTGSSSYGIRQDCSVKGFSGSRQLCRDVYFLLP